MKRRIALFFAVCMICVIGSGCAQRKISEARISFQNGDYEEVVTQLEGVKINESADREMLFEAQVWAAFESGSFERVVSLMNDAVCTNDTLEKLLLSAQVRLSFDRGDYQGVINLLPNDINTDEELKNIRLLSVSHLAFDNHQYSNVIATLLELPEGKEQPIYRESLSLLMEELIQNMDAAGIADLYDKDTNISDQTFQLVTSACENLEYPYFLLVDELIDQLPESNLRDQFVGFGEQSSVLRAKAFLIGEWEWQDDCELKTRVNIFSYQDDLMATVTQVSDVEEEYQILVGDIYCREYVFIDDTTFTCMNLCKTPGGNVVDVTAFCHIDFKQQVLTQHLTAPAPYHIVNADRTWTRVPSDEIHP